MATNENDQHSGFLEELLKYEARVSSLHEKLEEVFEGLEVREYLHAENEVTGEVQYLALPEHFRIGFIGSEGNFGNDFGVGSSVGGRCMGIARPGTEDCLPDRLPKLSREHCELRLENGQRVIYDLGSRTGTYVNGERISEERKKGSRILNPGDVIGLIFGGNDSFLLNIKYETKNGKQGDLPEVFEGLEVREYLQTKNEVTGEVQYLALPERFRIGFITSEWNFGNDFGVGSSVGGRCMGIARPGIEDRLPKLSREHCGIRLEDRQRVIYDLGSRTGTYVNGERISEERKRGSRILNPGDVIGLIPDGDNRFLLNIKYITQNSKPGDQP